MSNYNVIRHYASEYYDPVKAHEYYEQHKKLKGRSTSSLNDTGKAAAEYVKDQLTQKRDNTISTSKTNMANNIESSRQKANTAIENARTQMEQSISAHSTQMSTKIEAIQSRIKRIKSDSSGESKKTALRAEIAKLREENNAKKEELKSAFSLSSTQEREQHKATTASEREQHKTNSNNAKSEYTESYAAELDKILADPNMLKKSSKSSSVKKVTSGKSASEYINARRKSINVKYK